MNQLKFTDEFLMETRKAFQGDMKKSTSYLVGFHRLRELNLFTDEKIRDALLKAELDTSKAYDFLST